MDMSNGYANICDLRESLVKATACARSPGKGTTESASYWLHQEAFIEEGTSEKLMRLNRERQRENISGEEAEAGSAEVKQEVKVSVQKQFSIVWLKCRVCVGVY